MQARNTWNVTLAFAIAILVATRGGLIRDTPRNEARPAQKFSSADLPGKLKDGRRMTSA